MKTIMNGMTVMGGGCNVLLVLLVLQLNSGHRSTENLCEAPLAGTCLLGAWQLARL
jgi:hypothetical protein